MLARQFLSASVKETLSGVWEVRVVYSYYALYSFIESRVFDSLVKATRWLLLERCGGDAHLRVLNKDGLEV